MFPQTPTALTFIKTAQIGEEEVSVVETHSTTPTCQLIVKNPVAYAKSAQFSVQELYYKLVFF